MNQTPKELNELRAKMFQAFSKCLVNGETMTPTEIADTLLNVTNKQENK